MKSQCCFILQELLRDGKMSFKNLSNVDKDMLKQEFENIRVKDPYADKLYIESKEDLKKRIGRSPDIFDTVMMRCLFEVLRREKVKSDYIKRDPWSIENIMSIK